MDKVILGILSVLAVIYTVPFLVYGTLSSMGKLEKPKGSPSAFLLSVLVSKIGASLAFFLFYFAHDTFSGRWPLYAGIWWLMFVIGEVGQAIGPNYSRKEAIAGIISETIYFPLAAYLLVQFI